MPPHNQQVDPLTVDRDVRKHSGTAGFEASMIRSQPSWAATSATGGGSVTFGEKGAVMNPGTTSGDTAQIHGPKMTWFDRLEHKYYRFAYHAEGNNYTGDTMYLGHFKNSGGAGWFLDLANGNLSVDGTTYALDWNGKAGAVAEVFVNNNDYLRLNHYHDNTVDTYEVSAPSNPNPGQMFYTQSNGNGDALHVAYSQFRLWEGHEGGTDR